jgi:hypothetical protein
MEVRIMKRWFIASIAVMSFGALLGGCAEGSSTPFDVSIVEAKLQEWTSPDDGKTYLLAIPTWENVGERALVEVWMRAKLTGPKGEFESPEPLKPHYCGDEILPGTTFKSSSLPEDAIVVGENEEVLARTGPNPGVEILAVGLTEHAHAEGPNPANPPPL